MGCNNSTIAYDHAILQPQKTAVTVISPQFVSTSAVTLAIKKKGMSWSGDDATITDAHTGAVRFTIQGNALSFHRRKTLLDAQGGVVVHLKEPMWSRKQCVLSGADDHVWFEIAPQTSLCTTTINFQVADHVTRATLRFSLDGSWTAGNAVIRCNGAVVAKVLRTTKCLLDHYTIDVAPGVDQACILLICVALDEANTE